MIGVTERDNEFSGGTLYCSVLFFDSDGQLLGKHRKLKPTAAERIVWGKGMEAHYQCLTPLMEE